MIARAALPSLLLGLFAALGTADCLRAETFTIDPVHSAVLYRAGHMNVSHSWGRFTDISGTLALDDPNAESNSIDITVKATSIDSGAAARDEHLRGPDFLNVKQFPTITFKSTQIKAADPKTLEVTGNLTIHGVSKPVTLKVERVGAGKSPMAALAVGLETTFKINRSDFDMKNMLNMIADEVMLTVSLEAGHK